MMGREGAVRMGRDEKWCGARVVFEEREVNTERVVESRKDKAGEGLENQGRQ